MPDDETAAFIEDPGATVEPADEEAEAAAAAEAEAAQAVAAAAIADEEADEEHEDIAGPVEDDDEEEIPEHPFGGAPAQVVMVEGSNAFEVRKQAAIAKRIDSKK